MGHDKHFARLLTLLLRCVSRLFHKCFLLMWDSVQFYGTLLPPGGQMLKFQLISIQWSRDRAFYTFGCFLPLCRPIILTTYVFFSFTKDWLFKKGFLLLSNFNPHWRILLKAIGKVFQLHGGFQSTQNINAVYLSVCHMQVFCNTGTPGYQGPVQETAPANYWDQPHSILMCLHGLFYIHTYIYIPCAFLSCLSYLSMDHSFL